MTPEIKESPKHKYDVAISVKMPGQTRINTYHIEVMAFSPVDAVSGGIAEWRRETEPRNVQVKEIVGATGT